MFTLLLTTARRTSGTPHTTPLIYGEDDSNYVVGASNGCADEHPDWYRNYRNLESSEVEIQVESRVMAATARTASGDERSRLWEKMAEIWPNYDR